MVCEMLFRKGSQQSSMFLVVRTHKVATTKLMAAKMIKTVKRPIPSTKLSRPLSKSSSSPEDKTARPRADPDMAMKTIDH